MRRPGGRDPRLVVLELEEVKCQLECVTSDLKEAQADAATCKAEKERTLEALKAMRAARTTAEEDQQRE
eukprot:scaffold170614_cov37-Prasinocladus_malaysianus.AAC.1